MTGKQDSFEGDDFDGITDGLDGFTVPSYDSIELDTFAEAVASMEAGVFALKLGPEQAVDALRSHLEFVRYHIPSLHEWDQYTRGEQDAAPDLGLLRIKKKGGGRDCALLHRFC